MSQFFKILLLIFFINTAHALDAKIVAVVEDQSITEHDVNSRINLIIKTSGMPKSNSKVIRDRVIEMLIDEKLVESAAHDHNISITDQELSQAYDSLAEKNRITREQFFGKIKASKIDKHALDQQIKSQLLWSKMLASQVQPHAEITKAEIDKNRADIEKQLKQETQIAEYKLSEIAFHPKNKKDIENKMALAEKIANDLRGGANFESVARQFSQGINAGSGGVIGWLLQSQMNPAILAHVKGQPKGHITDPVMLEDGVHIFMITDKKVIKESEVSITDDEIRAILMNRKVDTLMRNYIRKLRRDAYIEMN